MIEPVQVMRGRHHEPDDLFGPLPGYRAGQAVAYEFELPERFEPWRGRSRIERTFVLLDVGVSFANPCWVRSRGADGTVTEIDPNGLDSWYVDLISVDADGDSYIFRDLYLDSIVPTDGRTYRILDLDEYADAMASGTLGMDKAIDGLRRWQRFLDRYLHGGRWPPSSWADFPPSSIQELRNVTAPFGTVVRWEE